jgi:hypothetical protein
MPFAIIPSEEISHRGDFVLLVNARGYLDAVEVGVDMGVFARDFLRRFEGNWLIGVDPYRPYAGSRDDRAGYDRTPDIMAASVALAPYLGKYRLIRATSPGAIPFIKTFSHPDFVYIDGDHREASVRADIEGWWEALGPDGLLAGHDWHPEHPGVMAAVERFARDRDLVVRLTHEDLPAAASWYIYKTEPPTLKVSLFRRGEEANPHAHDGS